MTTLTPRSSQHDTKDTTDHDDDSISDGNTSQGLLTPEATPASTPVITATMYHHHQQQPATPRDSLHSISSVSSSKTFACSSGDGSSGQGGGSGSGMATSPLALTLPGTIVSDLEQQEQQEWNNIRDDGDNDSNDPQLLQDTVQHFSSYRMSFPPPLPNSSTPSTSSTAANPLNNTSTSTSTATPPATRAVSASQTMPPFTTATATPTTTTMRPSTGKKSRNPFLTMFGRTSSSTTSSPSPSSLPLRGPISLGGVTQVNSQHPPSPKAHKSSSGGSSNGSRSGRNKEDKKSGDEKKKRRSSWFKSATTTTAAAATTAAATATIQRGRANTMFDALPSSSFSGSHLNNHRGSPSSPSSANTVRITVSGPESSASGVTAAAALGGALTAKRFSTPFQFNLREPGSRRSTLPTMNSNSNSNSTSTSRAPSPPLSSSPSSSSSCQNNPSIASFPRHLHAQPYGSQSHPQYYYYSTAAAAAVNLQQHGPSTRTTTGSFFDSVSDDSDSDSDEGFPSQYQQRQQYQHQLQQAPPPHYYQQQHVQPQQQQSAAVSSRQHEQDHRYQSYDSDDDSDSSEGEEEEESEDDSVEDSDEEDLDVDDEEETNSSYHYHDQQVVNPELEGNMHEFDDAPPPPSYHSLIRAEADAARSAALATLFARGQQQQHTHSHAHIHAHAHSSPPSTLLTGLYPPNSTTSSSSSSIITPTEQASTPPASSSPQVSPTVLANLLTLLHTFESHLLAHHKTPSFQAQQPTAATMSRRQAWLDRNPQTIASFAYLLIELQQTGILPAAMSPSWSSTSPSSSPSSPGSSLSASMALGMSEQDWLSMTGNAATEADLAKALLALEQSCLLAMDPVLWRSEGGVTRDAWMRQVQAIITSSSNHVLTHR
ncbi:hypothetical protein EC957_001136 [Mortierella hygrophila]|uniref:Uncharacterized protein n=1 Tax=Mortierella hygrophila TaxID=979708 RepID=A0A9P6FGP4_9FUNG|nr:hypothetical protein EC957_001136 [Mortierella hygrophila]